MHITPDEAQAALNDIEDAAKQARHLVNTWAYFMLLWGVVWTLGFLVTQFALSLIVWIWSVMLLVGMGGSMILGILQGQRTRPAPGAQSTRDSTLYGIFNGVLYGFVLLWVLLIPLKPLHIGLLWITAEMMSAIMAGIWLRQPLSLVLGIGVTLITIVGYLLLPGYFWAWSALFAGLPLIIVGISFLRRR
ncbi:hypothetical protein KSC_085680 [Ktedonobacter sp. SOSP1-52]|uniref:hypothetical protein n=1 Tax=Ktedonobacter sp. SOSP1-52 TaxID=2778366 RepID=UPI0019152D80|nr:hypothetical protein [Ktedonobacter sp. SOSP1-52]GHO69676.1 hypothetical protein KSC_085680 [Ktedonobacter sp. SOSP1-52]